MSNDSGSSNTAIVAILAIMLGAAAWFFVWGPGVGSTTVIKEKNTVIEKEKDSESDDGGIDIKIGG